MKIIATVAFVMLTGLFGTAHAAIDENAARSLAKKTDCFTCHAIDKTKKGPSYQKIAIKYKGKVDAEATLIKQITTGPKVKMEDGTEENHKIIDGKDQGEMKNLVGWILSL